MVKILFTIMEGKSDTTMVKQNIGELTIKEQLNHMTAFFSQDLRYLNPSDCYRKELDLYEAISIFRRRQLPKSSIYMNLQDRFKSSDDFRSEFCYLFEGDNPKYNVVINGLCRDIKNILRFMQEGELRDKKGKLNNFLFGSSFNPYYIKKDGDTKVSTRKDKEEKEQETEAQRLKRLFAETPSDEIQNDRIREDLVKARKMAKAYCRYRESLYVEDFIRRYGLTKEDFDLLRVLLLVHDKPAYNEFLTKYRENREKRKKIIEKRMKAIKAVSEGRYVFPNENDKNIFVMSMLPRCNEEDLIAFGLPPRATLKCNFETLYNCFFGNITKGISQLAIDNIVVRGSYTLSHAKMTKNDALNMNYSVKGKSLNRKQKRKIVTCMKSRNIVFTSRLFVLLANSMLCYGRTLDEKYYILRKDMDIRKAIGKNKNKSVFVKAKKIAKH